MVKDKRESVILPGRLLKTEFDAGKALMGKPFAAQFKAAEFGLGHRQSEEHTRKVNMGATVRSEFDGATS
jgi:hypothetical protein